MVVLSESFASTPRSAKAIVSSGYGNGDPIMTEFKRYGFSGGVAKPFQLEDLETALAKTIQN